MSRSVHNLISFLGEEEIAVLGHCSSSWVDDLLSKGKPSLTLAKHVDSASVCPVPADPALVTHNKLERTVRYCSCLESSNRQQSVQGQVVVSITESSSSHTDIRAHNLTGDNAESKQSSVCDGHSHRNIKTSEQQESVILEPSITEDVVTEVATEDCVQQYPLVELQSLSVVQRETETLAAVGCCVTEPVDSVSCSLGSNITPQTSAVKPEFSLREVDENTNSRTTERHCKTICEDDLSVFFTSPISVPSLSAKLKTIPKRKATSKCKLEVTPDGDRALVCDDNKATSIVDCVDSRQQTVLPLHDAATGNSDNPHVSVHVASYENSAISQSNNVSESSYVTSTSHCGPVYPLADANVHLSECLVSQSAVSLVPSFSSSVVASSLTLKSSEYDLVKLVNNSAVPLLNECTNTIKPVSNSSGTQVQSCITNSEQPLLKPVRQFSVSKQRFLYPSAAPISHVFEHSSTSEGLFPPKRPRSVLYRTPEILQPQCTVAFSKAEEFTTNVPSSGMVNDRCSAGIKEVTALEDHGVNSESVLTLQLENGLETTSDVVSYGLNTVVVASCVSAVCDIKDVTKDTLDDSVPTHAIVDTKSVSAYLPSTTDNVCCSKPVCDFAGQTSPTTVSNQTTLCDVGVQAGRDGLLAECTSCVKKQPLLINAAVQTESVCLVHCTCDNFCQLCRNRRDDSRQNDLQRMNGLCHSYDYHDTGSVTETEVSDMNCNSLVSNSDIGSFSNTCINRFVATGGYEFQNARTFVGQTDVEGQSNMSLLNGEGMKTVFTNKKSVAAEHAEPLSLDDNGVSYAADHESVSSDRDVDSFTVATDNPARVVNDTPLKNMDSSLLKSCSTGFVSAGGKRLNVKLSSTLSAHKLLSDVAPAESDRSDNAACTDTEPIQFTTSRLIDTGRDSKQVTGNEYSAQTAATINCVGMLRKSGSNDQVSNGFKPFKAPRSMQSSKHRKKKLLTKTEDQLSTTNKVESHSFSSEDRVNSVGEAELLCDLTNTQRAEVLDASLAMLNSVELFATQCGDNLVDPAVEQMVACNSAAVNVLVSEASDECVSYSSFSPNTNTPKYSPVSVMPATKQIFENVLTGQVHDVCDVADPEARRLNIDTLQIYPVVDSDEMSEFGQICSVEENAELRSLTAAGTEAELRDDEESRNMPNVFMDAQCTDAELVPTGTPSSQLEEIDTDQATFCSCVNDQDQGSCMHAADMQKLLQSSEQTTEHEVSETTRLLDSRLSPDDRDNDTSFSRSEEHNQETPVTRSNPFVFFSAKGNEIKVSEKTLSSIRKSWSDNITNADSTAQSESTQLLDGGQVYSDVRDMSSSRNSRAIEVNKPMELNKETPMAKSNPFVFFSAKGSEIKVSEKTLSSIRKSWSDDIAGVRSVGVDNGTLRHVADGNEESAHYAVDIPASIDDAVIDAKVLSTDISQPSCIPVSSANVMEQRPPLKAMNLFSVGETVACKRHTDQCVRMPLYAVPEKYIGDRHAVRRALSYLQQPSYCSHVSPLLSEAVSSNEDEYCASSTLVADARPSTSVNVSRNKPSVQFVVPFKHNIVKARNDAVSNNEQNTHVIVARPVVMHTLSQTQSNKCLSSSSNIKLPDLHSDRSRTNTDELLQSSVKARNFVVNSAEPIRSPVLNKSHFIDSANVASCESSLTVSATAMSNAPQQQELASPDAAASNDTAFASHSLDINKHSSVDHLCGKVVNTVEQSSALSATDNSMKTQRLICKESQLNRIANKRKLWSIKASPGSLLMSRNNANGNRLSLNDAVCGARPRTYSLLEMYACGLKQQTLLVSSSNAMKFCFHAEDGETEIRIGDGAVLVFNENGLAGCEEFANAMADMPNVMPHLISSAWVSNHYRWIVWKLAAMEVSFPQQFGGRCLTAHNVMLRLKYRYDIEVDRSHRLHQNDDMQAVVTADYSV